MKRSDAIRMLCAIINVHTRKTIDEFSGDFMCTLEEAEVVLKKLEDLGMLPPPVKGRVSVIENDDDSVTIPLWSWEEEND